MILGFAGGAAGGGGGGARAVALSVLACVGNGVGTTVAALGIAKAAGVAATAPALEEAIGGCGTERLVLAPGLG